MVSLVTMVAAVFLLVMTVLGIALTWISLQDESHTPQAVRSDESDDAE